MSATILSGIDARTARIPLLVEQIKKLSRTPTLAIIQVGDRSDSTAYIRAKKTFAQKIGVHINHIHFPVDVSQDKVVRTIGECNTTDGIAGIIVQLPLPEHIDRTVVIEAIAPEKDVDGLTQTNYRKLLNGEASAILPATARGVRELCTHYLIPLKGKKVAVVGRSLLVGTPIAILCKQSGADVIVCHSKTVDLAHETSKADVVIVAVGKPNLITAEHVKVGAIVIDVGISKLDDGTIHGDVDYPAVREVASAITPVPGGVGPMTVLGLFENVVDASVRQVST